MPLLNGHSPERLTGHALRNAHLRERALERAATAPPLARTVVRIRAQTLGLTRLEFARRSGISRGTLRDLELGVHVPTRRVLQQFMEFCQACNVAADQLEELRSLYAGPADSLEQFIARLELRAGSSRELARRVGISPATLWEYRRGNFPLPLDLLERLCQAAGEEFAPARGLWHAAERQRFLGRGYPEALAEFWVLCTRAGYAERDLFRLGLGTAAARRLRYLELPPWEDVAAVARHLCRDRAEQDALQRLWVRDEQGQGEARADGFGSRLKLLRKQGGVTRRELADLFGVGGKKPARILKYIEEDGFYSAQAYPAGLTVVLTADEAERARLRELWQQRRHQFHRRHRPETRTDLRLAREFYGFELGDMEPILGYTSLEYQRIERGVVPLAETAHARVLKAIEQAGQEKLAGLIKEVRRREAERVAWQLPPTVPALVTLLARREGGLIPLTRLLRRAGLRSLWAGRLRAIAQGKEIPAWPVLEDIGRVCGVTELDSVRQDWRERYRERLQAAGGSPLGVELRLLIAEVAATIRAFSPRLGFNYSVLIRDLQKIDRDEPVKWFHVERVLRAAGVAEDDARWQGIHAWWYATTLKGKPRRRRRPEPGANGVHR